MSIRKEDPFTWGEVEPHLDRALELEPQARKAWLAELSATHPDIAKAVALLLTEQEEMNAEGFLLDSPFAAEGMSPVLQELLAQHAVRETGELNATVPRGANLSAGAIVGNYRLIREIGHGGMSSVWLAERVDGQLKREVAVKLPLIGPRMHVERFMRERDILAALTHPNIARLYDAGISDAGQPYLAMEYVDGTSLIDYCDERRLPVGERLQVFVQVLDAVQFAHAQLIIHRDLKPSNILVTAQGRVVLLDFGIGKLLTDGADDAHLTQMAGRALTPHYASPEQIAGHSLGTASDIYSLGVVLYELLTGARPHRPKHDSRAALEEAILSGDVRRPSQSSISAEAAAARGATVRSLTRALSGDLDTIVLKALKKAPGDRYASISAFAQDIANNLNSLPVSARPDSRWYRVGRFVVRHKIPVGAGVIAAFALVGGATLALWQARAAATERDRAVALASRNEAVSEFLGRVIVEAAESEKPVTVSEMLARSEKLALEDTTDSPENRAAVLEMIADRYYNIDDLDRATQLMKSALALVENSPDRVLRSRLKCRFATVSAEFSHMDGSIRALTREIEQLDAEPRMASRCLLDLTRLYLAERRVADAIRSAKDGIERIRTSGQEAGETEAALMGALAYAYHLDGSNVEAERYFEQALRKYTSLQRQRSDGALTVMNDWGIVILIAGMPRHALSLFDEIESIEKQREAGGEPTTTAVGNRALALLALGRFEQARAALDLECSLSRKRNDELSEIHCLIGLTNLALQLHAPDEAAEYLDRATQMLQAMEVEEESPPMLTRTTLQGRLALERGRLIEARTQYSRVLASANAGPSVLISGRLGKAELELAEGNAAAAAQEARLALQTVTELQGGLPYSHQAGHAWLMLGRSLQQLGDRAQAHKAFGAAVANLSNTVDENHPALLQAREMLAL